METSSSFEERPSENEMNGVADHMLSKHQESSDLDEYEPGAEDEDDEEGEGSNQAEVVGFHNRWSSDGGKRGFSGENNIKQLYICTIFDVNKPLNQNFFLKCLRFNNIGITTF